MINKSTIKFDENFKHFIKNLYKQVEKEWFIASYDPSYDDMHEWIEEYVRKNSQGLVYNGNIISMPNLFAINICLLLGNEIDKYYSFEEIKFSKENFDKICSANYSFDESSDSRKLRCACKHQITPVNTYYISSNFNKIKIQLGQDCIEKTGISSEFLNKLKKQAKTQYCESKTKMNLVLDELKKEVEIKKINRKCLDCNKYNVLKTSPSFIKRCLPCFRKFNNSTKKKEEKEKKRNKSHGMYDLDEYTYFEIPYEKKNEFKKIGGKFDGTNKLWFIKNSLAETNKDYIAKQLGKKVIWNDCDHCQGTGDFCYDSCWFC